MAQWYTQLIFKGDALLGDSLVDWQDLDGTLPPEGANLEPYTAVIVSGYALYGNLQGYYALGVAHIGVDPATGKAYYCSEQSALHREPVESLTNAQRKTIHDWLIEQAPGAWENSVNAFKRSLVMEPG